MRVSTGQQKYVNATFGIPDADLERVRKELHAKNVDHMSISGAEGRILQFLVRGFGVRKVVEVGCLFGYSALCMAKALPADGEIYTLEKNPENAEIAKKMISTTAVADKIHVLTGDGAVLLGEIEKNGPFDLVFIDADKGGYGAYLDWADKNVKRGGLIIGDNTFLFGALWGEAEEPESEKRIQVMKDFNARLADPKKYNSVLIPTAEGMTVAQKL